MKRRDFLATSAGLAGAMLPALGRGLPCPPPTLSAVGGTSSTNPCNAPGTAPAWFTGMGDKTWAAPLSNWLGASGVKDPLADTTNAGNDGHSALISNWTGMLADEERRTIAMLGNGGHAGYNGNEVYSCDLGLNPPAWVRRRNATPSVPGVDMTKWPDGRPVSDHTAQLQCAGGGRWFKFGLASTNYNGWAHYESWWEYSLATEDYINRSSSAYSLSSSVLAVDGLALFDSIDRNFLIFHKNFVSPGIGVVDSDTLALKQGANPGGFGTSNTLTAAIDTRRRLLLVRMDIGCEVWNLETFTKLGTITPSGAQPTLHSSLYYHEPSDAFITWDGGSGIRKLKPTANAQGTNYTALAWSTVTPAGGSTATPPGSGPGQGMYNKVQLLQNMGNGQSALVIVPQYAAPDVFVFKLPSAGI